MVKSNKSHVIGAWAFLIGIILSLVLGLFNSQIGATWQKAILGILIVLGIAVGFLNISGRENSKFLLAAAVLVIVSFMGQAVLSIIPQVGRILSSFLVLFVPTTIIVALRTIFELSKD